MTCLMARVLSRAGMKFHTSMLGTFFVCTLGLSMPIFKKKSLWRFPGKSSKLFTVLMLLQWKAEDFFPEISTKIFSWKLACLVPKCIQVPNLEVCKFIPALLRTLIFQAIHCSTLLIRCVKFCSCVYVHNFYSCKKGWLWWYNGYVNEWLF